MVGPRVFCRISDRSIPSYFNARTISPIPLFSSPERPLLVSGFMNSDGSALIGGLLPSGVGEALQLDAAGNLKISGAGSDTSTSGTVQNNNDATGVALRG